ncbi:MAG: hypothetical protein ABSE59_11665 [Opitutaceae bacterium]
MHRDASVANLSWAKSWWLDWPKSVGLYLSGDLPESEFFKQAGTGDTKAKGEKSCQAFYFAGMIHLLANEPAAAQKLFEKCVATNSTDIDDIQLARDELARLSIR